MSGAGNQQERLSSSEEARRWFLAGVVEGEGSWCISVKRHQTARFGYYVQPEFFIYQHRVRRELLEIAQEILGCGRIWPKSGNPDVLVFGVTSRPKISAHVLPFMRDYMRFSCRRGDIALFQEAMVLFEGGFHREAGGLAAIVEIAYEMNMNGKQRCRPLDEILDRILRGHTLNAH